MDELDQLLQQHPELMDQLMALGPLDDKAARLGEDASTLRSKALRQPKVDTSTGASALFGGLSNAMGDTVDRYQKKGIDDQLAALDSQKVAGRKAYMSALAQALASRGGGPIQPPAGQAPYFLSDPNGEQKQPWEDGYQAFP